MDSEHSAVFRRNPQPSLYLKMQYLKLLSSLWQSFFQFLLLPLYPISSLSREIFFLLQNQKYIAEAAHRSERYAGLAGCTPEDIATPERAARVLEAEALHTRVLIGSDRI